MGLLGVIGKNGMYRYSNMMALLDAHVRGVGPDKALGGRNWSNYTWHGDQAPGHPFVHGLQTSDIDLNDYRFSKLTVHVGKNMIENKMPEAHWLTEMMERGGRIVVIAPEYNPPATKADYWIPVRAGLSDISIFLGVSKVLMDKGWVDYDFVKKFTDFPLLIRTDTLKRLRADEVFPNYRPGLLKDGPSFEIQELEDKQYDMIGDRVVFDKKTGSLKAITRDDVGERLTAKGIDPVLEWKGKVRLVGGSEVEVMTLWEMYKIHLKDYDLDTVAQITEAPKELIERLARDIGRRFWDPDFKGKPRSYYPISIHYGEGINHYFHATLHNRATYLPLMLVGSIGVPGSGSHTWAGNYKAALFQGSHWSGPGFKGWVAEDPFNPNLDPNADGKEIKVKGYAREEEVGYWAHGDRPLIVNTPKYGRKVFTGKTHLPTPTKVIWETNVNLINNAKWAYELIKNTDPLIDLIVDQEIEWTGTSEYSDVILPANSWMEFEDYEVTASCSNPYLQIWKGGIKPLFDTRDDMMMYVGVAEKLTELTGDRRFSDYWKFAGEKRTEVYIQRLLDGSTTCRGYEVADILTGKYGESGACLMLFRTYPRVPFWEQVNESIPFYTDTGRLHAYCDIPEAIEHGENFVAHREGPEATKYLPNVIVSTNPFIRPDDQGITPELLQRGDGLDWESRHVANNKLPWSEVKKTKNPLWEKGYRFLCATPKSRHTVHSSWTVTDWNWIWSQNFGDPYRMDKRQPGVNDWQIHMNPQAARDLGINDGDYVFVDADLANRPYRGAKPDDPFFKVARLMLRVKYNPAYPYHFTMMKHASFIATERTVKAHEERPDGRALSPTGYQASFRYGSQQSITISWLMPMHQTDSLFHKSKTTMHFIFGFEADNHAINSTPKETLIRITKAEDGGLGGRGVWEPARTGFSPGNESDSMKRYLQGDLVKVKT
jgi:nitrate reductase alpha subunit